MLSIGILTGSAGLDVLLLFLASWLTWSYISYRRLSHIPGPRLWGLSVLPLLKLHQDGKTYHTLAKFCEEYGPLVRVSPNSLITRDADVIRRMNAARSPYTRADWYVSVRLNPGQDNVLSVTDEKDHDSRRKKMAAGYSGKENISLERDLDECILDLCRLIDAKYAVDAGSESQHPKPMDLARKMQFLTIDIMSKLSFDAKFHDLRDDNDNYGYINEVETMWPKIFSTCCLPKLLHFMNDTGLMKLMMPSDASFGFAKILAITKQQVSQRFDAEKNVIVQKPDMLGSFLKHGLTSEEAEQESVLQLVAGSDTSATGMRSTLYNLITNPRAYTKLMAEIDAAMANSSIPSDATQIISDAAARELPYLQACIREGLRWLPPIAGMLPKKTPPEGDVICGYAVPGGVDIGWCPKAIHHNPEIYGPDPKAYRPDRWIHTSEGGDEPSRDKISVMEKNNDLIFGHGKYMCLGKPVAVIELNKIFVELLRRFEFNIMNPEDGWKGGLCYGIFFQKDLWVTVKRRPVKV